MKQKKYLFIAAAAALFAACSSDDATTEQVKQQAPQEVSFSAYVNRGTTRAGAAGDVSNESLMTVTGDIKTAGFGVFAYYSDGIPYSETATPDFMYNQQVTYGSDWTYTPVKYWPNEFGQLAISDNQDRLTFFAYAPWVAVDPQTGRVTGSETEGIVGLTSNTATGDPYVKYFISTDPAKSVDLCWGVAATANKPASVDNTNAANVITAGAPYINVYKPGADGADTKINFDFKHALAKLNVQIDATIDEESTSANNDYDAGGTTKIWVRSITFEGFTDKGKLNLHSTAPNPEWYEISSASTKIGSGSVTIHDGRINGKEGKTGAVATNETVKGLNEQLIQSAPYKTTPYTTLAEGADHTGVPSAEKGAINLFNSATKTAPIYVIPTNDNLKVTIVYDVETSDEKLAKYLSDGAVKGSTIENTISNEITFGTAKTLEAGKAYTINLHLGMTSVKFDASVSEWTDITTVNTDLPINGPVTPAP